MLGLGLDYPACARSRSSGPVYGDYALALDFKQAAYRSGMLLTNDPTALPGYSYTRSGAKSELNASSGLTSFAANVPGIVPGVGYWSRLGLTNLVLTSSASQNSTDPAGGATANLGGGPSITATIATATTYTASRFVKKDPSNTDGWVRVYVFETASSANRTTTWVNVVTGAIGSQTVGGAGFTAVGSAMVTPVTGSDGTQWYRVSFSFQSTTATAVTITSTAANGDAVTTTSGGSHYTWHSQIVAGAQSGPVIVTTGSTASVGSDSLEVNYAQADEDFIAWVSVNLSGATGVDMRLLNLTDGTANNRIILQRNSSNVFVGFIHAGGVAQTLSATAAPATTSGTGAVLVRRLSGAFSLHVRNGDGAIYHSAGNAGTMPTITKAQPGIQLSFGQPNAPIGLVAARRGTYTDAQVAAILAAA